MTMTPLIRRFLDGNQPATPCLIMDLPRVRDNYAAMRDALPMAEIFYAMKANPAPEVMADLITLGASFDTASRGEIDQCLAAGIAPARISFGNTIKKEADIAHAHAHGVRLFAFDSEGELEKLARAAPGADVYCRILVDTVGAEWPLSRKFGCDAGMAVELLVSAARLGLNATGVSFHVGSQQTNPAQWEGAIAAAADVFACTAARGVALTLINLGGGMPAAYRREVPSPAAFGGAIAGCLARYFPQGLPRVIVEPGRSLVADAGVIVSEVVLVSRKSAHDDKRWVYLDAGRFNGLAETMDEAIRYPIATARDGGPAGPVVLAGPTCDSADILYERTAYQLPLDLRPGDRVEIHTAGAYTSTYASIAFNGFNPLPTYCVGGLDEIAGDVPAARLAA